MRAPDFIEPLIGYRCWWIDPQGYLSSHQGKSWIPGAEPDCIYQNAQHLPPVSGCQCGWHVYKNIYPALLFARPDQLVGKVHIWGRVEEHDDGYRGQYAKPVGLASLGLVSPEAIQAVADRYQAAVIGIQDFWAQNIN